jgi:hypothetical protein
MSERPTLEGAQLFSTKFRIEPKTCFLAENPDRPSLNEQIPTPQNFPKLANFPQTHQTYPKIEKTVFSMGAR